jgi:hypothetical protein
MYETEIQGYTEYFRKRLSDITKLTEFEQDIDHILLYQKILYMSMIDSLSRSGFPSVQQQGERFKMFLDTCSRWKDKDRVSSLQLMLRLEEKSRTSSVKSFSDLYTHVKSRVESWLPGDFIRPESDPIIDELRSIAGEDEKSILRAARYVELLYTYRNHLVHEFRAPGTYGDMINDPEPYYYHVVEKSWQLIFPAQFFAELCKGCLDGLETHLMKNQLNPYDAYEFGTLWRRR